MLAEPEAQVSLCFCNQIERERNVTKVKMVMEDAEELEGEGTAGRRKAPGLSSDTSRSNNREPRGRGGVGSPPSIRCFLPLTITAFLLFFESPSLK